MVNVSVSVNNEFTQSNFMQHINNAVNDLSQQLSYSKYKGPYKSRLENGFEKT